MNGVHEPGRREQHATRAVFFVIGAAVGVWAPLVPLVKTRLSLEDGPLGLLLFCLGLGSFVAMPFSGALATRFGCRRVMVTGTVVLLAGLVGGAWAGTTVALTCSLLAFGAGMGVVDVVMNLQAVMVEKAGGRPMMSGFHGMFSVGGAVGAIVTTRILESGVPSATVGTAMGAALVLLMLASVPGLLPYAEEASGPIMAWPRGPVLALGLMCFAVFLAEGSVTDWGAVLLHQVRGMPQEAAGVGYIAFATTMTLGRFAGDYLVGHVGRRRVVVLGATVLAVGYLMVALIPTVWTSVAGFALVGIGASNIVPVLFTAAGQQEAMPTQVALPAISTLGYLGFLIGPAFLGQVSQRTSLPAALMLVAFMCGAVAVGGVRLRLSN